MNMKRIFKFFPVALAAFALASCSSDDLNVTNSAGELLNVDGKLLVQVEGGDEGTMRSGFMTTINPTSAMLRSSLFFSAGDQLKLYHDATSWKPEVWTATAFGQYTNATGAASSEEGSVAVFDKADAEITEAENAYGIFPADLGQFGNENRTSLKYNLSGLKFIEYKAEAKDYNDGSISVTAAADLTGNTKAYTAPFPLWGVKKAGAKVMTMKHLAGILRVDLANIDNHSMTTAQARYIVIKSTNKLTGDLATAADVFKPTTAEEVNPTSLMTKQPKLVTTAATGTTALTAVPTTKAGITNDDIIVVELTNADPDHVMLFVPITAGNAGGDIKIYVSTPVTKGTNIAVGASAANQAKMGDGTTDAIYTLDAATIQAENKTQLSGFGSLTPIEQGKVQQGVIYRINDDSSNQNTTAKTPWEMAQGIIAADQVAYRDFEINFTLPIEVKNEDTAPQNFYLDLSGENTEYGLAGYDLKHNVTVNVTLKKSADATTNPATLYIKTKSASSKKLTLNITNNASAIDNIVIKEGELRSELVLKEATGGAQLPKIQVYKGNDDKVTLEAGTTELITGSDIKVNNATAQKVADIKLAEGIKTLSLLDGEVTKIEMANGAAAPSKPINGNVNIYTEGNASIAEVDYANMPKTTTAGNSTDTYNLVYSSKWIKGSTATAATTTITGEAVKFITSANQLAAIAAATGNVRIIGTYDLNGSATNDWTALTGLTQNINGAQYFRYSNAAARAIEGNATIKNLVGAQGLIADWTPATAGDAIQNFTFDGGNKVEANTGALGLLVGTITTANNGTIKNIEVKGTNSVKGTSTTATQGFGAVIGKTVAAAAALRFVNVQVASGTTVHGYQYVGGIIGEIAGKVIFGLQSADGITGKIATTAVVAAGDVANSSAATLETYQIGSAPYSSALPTKGSFFGGASASAAAGDIKIFGGLTPATTLRTADKWGYYVADGAEYFPWTISLIYNEIGHCGYTVAAPNVNVDGAFKAIEMYTTSGGPTPTYSVKTDLVPFVGTQAAYNTAVGTAATYGIGKTIYFDFVKKP